MEDSTLGITAIALMALVVYGTRIAGCEVMRLVPMTPRIEAMLRTMASSVLVAIIVSECARGGFRTSAAVALAALTLALTRSPYAAMAIGVAAAAVYGVIAA